MKNKAELRILAKNIRKRLNMAEISKKIISGIYNIPQYPKSEHVMIFYPIQNEINLLPLSDDPGKFFYLPRVCGNELECCPYKAGDETACSLMNINEPCTNAVDKSVLDIIFVPALMADLDFNRLGYGAGYYDRFLNGIRAFKVIPVPEELVMTRLPAESHDIKCDAVITQKKVSF